MRWHDLLERLTCQRKELALTYMPDFGWALQIGGTPVNLRDYSCEHAVLRGVFEFIIHKVEPEGRHASE
jgi:hypothetical protein